MVEVGGWVMSSVGCGWWFTELLGLWFLGLVWICG